MSDAYPTEAELEAIKNWEPGGDDWSHAAWLGVLQECSDAWNHDMGHALWDDKTKQMTFVTGGWSGNEDVLGALSENRLAHSMLWQSSHRGGRCIYGLRPESTTQGAARE